MKGRKLNENEVIILKNLQIVRDSLRKERAELVKAHNMLGRNIEKYDELIRSMGPTQLSVNMGVTRNSIENLYAGNSWLYVKPDDDYVCKA